MNQRMSEKCTPLIRLHKHAFAVEVDTVLVLGFTGYDFLEGLFQNLMFGINFDC